MLYSFIIFNDILMWTIRMAITWTFCSYICMYKKLTEKILFRWNRCDTRKNWLKDFQQKLSKLVPIWLGYTFHYFLFCSWMGLKRKQIHIHTFSFPWEKNENYTEMGYVTTPQCQWWEFSWNYSILQILQTTEHWIGWMMSCPLEIEKWDLRPLFWKFLSETLKKKSIILFCTGSFEYKIWKLLGYFCSKLKNSENR